MSLALQLETRAVAVLGAQETRDRASSPAYSGIGGGSRVLKRTAEGGSDANYGLTFTACGQGQGNGL